LHEKIAIFIYDEKPFLRKKKIKESDKKEMPVAVDLEKCNGCMDIEGKEKGTSNCVEECPVECISLVEDDPGSAPHGREQHAVINNEECTDCEVCIDVCEQGALSMTEE